MFASLALIMGVSLSLSGMPAAPVEVMILGSYHMANPGLDMVNAEVDDVTQPRRQAEIAAVVNALAQWRPDKVLVEWQRPAPFTVSEYRAFTPADLTRNRNEIVQIGFRLARQLGHEDVYAFDEQPSDGEPQYWQFSRVEEFVAAHGPSGIVQDVMTHYQAKTAEFERSQASHSVAEQLLRHNDAEEEKKDNSTGYYTFLPIGNDDNQVGAEFATYWYMRNAKMFGKIGLIVQPGERVLVLVGSGHSYWLRHFAENVPGYVSVDPRPYLREAAGN